MARKNSTAIYPFHFPYTFEETMNLMHCRLRQAAVRLDIDRLKLEVSAERTDKLLYKELQDIL